MLSKYENLNMWNSDFTHHDIKNFKLSKLPLKYHVIYMLYRYFWFVYFYYIWTEVVNCKYMYFTHWVMFISLVDTLLQFAHVFDIINIGKTIWLFSNLTGSLQLFITIFYWALENSNDNITLRDVGLHIIPCFYAIIDTILSNIPRRIFHAYQPSIIVLLYMVFTVTFYREREIYQNLNWDYPWKTIAFFSIISVIVIPCLHIGLSGLYILSNYLGRLITKRWNEK